MILSADTARVTNVRIIIIIKESAGGPGRDWDPVGDSLKESVGRPGRDWSPVGDILKESAGGPGRDWSPVDDIIWLASVQ